MFSFPKPLQGLVLACAIFASISSITLGADRKVVRASHEGQRKEIPQQTEAATEDVRGTDVPPSEGTSKSSEASNESTLSYTPDWPEPPDTGAMLMRLLIGTGIVLVLCVGTLVLGKPWLSKFQIKGISNPAFQIEGSVTVGQRAMLHLVRVGGVQLVAGTDAGGLKSLIVLPTPFKDVLDEQMTEAPVATSAISDPLDLRSIQRAISKEPGHVELR